MRREEASQILEQLLARLEADERLSVVEELYVFGSYARGAQEPTDVDVDIELDPASLVAPKAGEPSLVALLKGDEARLGVSVNFVAHFPAGSKDIALLYRRGEPSEAARLRLQALASAGAGERGETTDFVLPALLGLERLLGRPDRRLLFLLVERGALTVSREKGRRRGWLRRADLSGPLPAPEALKLLRRQERLRWRLGGTTLVLERQPGFAEALALALEETGLVWHALIH